MEIKSQAFEVLDLIVKPIGTGAHVVVPKRWRGKRVKILLTEPLSEVNKE
jgi:putative transposon-encoded protein